jgi:NAD(P)-dependent dehydrogenase (short-subunit alcohol dehydrogenase family)
MTSPATPGIQQRLDPKLWKEHRFGLPAARWNSLSGRAFWITGAGTGYGRAISIALAAAGAIVYMTGRRGAKLDETRESARALGVHPGNMTSLAADITDRDSVSAATARIVAASTGLHGLVNNAAVPSPGPLATISSAQWQRLWDTNVTGAWLVTQAALPLLESRDSYRVVFMTSEAGWASTPGFGAYNASKAALNSLGASFAAELAQRRPDGDAQVNTLIAGEARTEMNRGSNESPYSVVCMALLLLSHPRGGPNGHFFHRDGRHFAFGYSTYYNKSLLEPDRVVHAGKDGITSSFGSLKNWLRTRLPKH